MKFLHTADWQIGMKATHVGSVGEKVREARLESLKRVIEAANEQRVDFIIAAGDCFENNAVSRVLVQKTTDIIARAQMPVFIIPGNHDPFVPGSVWDHPAWTAMKDVTIVSEEKPISVTGCKLLATPVREKHSDRDPTNWMRGDVECITLGVAHGTVEGVVVEEPDYPIDRDAVVRRGLDYLALGHWHSTALYASPEGINRMAYSGTHETTKFGERDSGNALIVEIAKKGAAPLVTTIKTGILEWLSLVQEIRMEGDLAVLREQVQSIKNAERVLLDLKIQGVYPAQDADEILRVQELIDARFLYGRLDISQAFLNPDEALFIESLPAGVIRTAAERLVQLTSPEYHTGRPDGVTPTVATRALLELYAIAQEVRR